VLDLLRLSFAGASLHNEFVREYCSVKTFNITCDGLNFAFEIRAIDLTATSAAGTPFLTSEIWDGWTSATRLQPERMFDGGKATQ
jgi:hypothetical protein